MDTYDASGNPTSYYNGERYTMTWTEGRRLESVTIGGQTYTYQYNADGQRVKKTNPDGSYIEYYVVNGVTVGESHFTAAGNKTLGIRYTLDENNTVIGFTTGGVNYYFAKNLQGDVLEVYNASTNEVVAQYTYDSWGNILTATGSMKDTNPFRYRGYYYDGETGFYYLQSRYYDSGIGRFINADALTSTGQGILGNNMFAYCNNNTINLADFSGKIPGRCNTVYQNDGENGLSSAELVLLNQIQEKTGKTRAELGISSTTRCRIRSYSMTLDVSGIELWLMGKHNNQDIIDGGTSIIGELSSKVGAIIGLVCFGAGSVLNYIYYTNIPEMPNGTYDVYEIDRIATRSYIKNSNSGRVEEMDSYVTTSYYCSQSDIGNMIKPIFWKDRFRTEISEA